MATRPATAPVAIPSALGLPWLSHSAIIPGERRGRRADMRHGHGHAGDPVGRQLTAGVEAEPSDPEHRGADDGQHQAIGWHRRGRVAGAFAEHHRRSRAPRLRH